MSATNPNPALDQAPSGGFASIRQRFGDRSWRQALQAPLVLALAAMLALQLLFALLLGRDSDLTPAAADAPLLVFEPDAVTAIRIEAGDGAGSVTLARRDTGWILPDLGDFPADASRVEQLLDRLGRLTRPLPVATSAASQQRFRVADEQFEQRLKLHGANEDLATLFLGDSPGYRRTFVRVAGEDAIYDLRLSRTEGTANADDWLDRGQLQLAAEQIQRIDSGDWSLTKEGDAWRLDGSEQAPDSAAVENLVRSLSALGYRGVLGTEEQPAYGLETPALTLGIGLAGGTSRSYRIGRIQESEDYALKVAAEPYYYRLAAFDLGDLLELSREKLLGEEPPVEGEGEEAPAPTEARPPEPQAAKIRSSAIPPAAPAAEPAARPDAQMADAGEEAVQAGGSAAAVSTARPGREAAAQ